MLAAVCIDNRRVQLRRMDSIRVSIRVWIFGQRTQHMAHTRRPKSTQGATESQKSGGGVEIARASPVTMLSTRAGHNIRSLARTPVITGMKPGDEGGEGARGGR